MTTNSPPAPAADKIKFDVAISFLSRDEGIGAALHERLSESLRVFFYPRKQEELAGTDGLESMRLPFTDESRLVVVLYREPWGNTEWTRVEETAIKERCLKHGWDSLFFVTLEKGGTLPRWLPRTHVRLSYPDFGLEQAVGAIKARVQELGGKIEPVNAITRAKLVRAEADYLAERAALFRSLEWIKGTVQPAVRELCSEVDRICRQVAAEAGIQVRATAAEYECGMTTGRVSLAAGWVQYWANVIDEKTHFAAREFNGRIVLPGERGWYPFGEPKLLNETRFRVELSRARELRWVEGQKSTALMRTAEVADKCVRLFLDLVQRANRGEIEFQFD